MSESLRHPSETSRKAHSRFLHAMEPLGTGKQLALSMGTSEATVSRIKDDMESCIAMLFQLGFKVVSSDRICVQRDKYAAMVTIARAALADDLTVQKLIWDEES